MKKVIEYAPGLDVRMFEDDLFVTFPKAKDVKAPYFTFGAGPPQFHLNLDYARALSAAIATAIAKYDFERAKIAADRIDDLNRQAHRVLSGIAPVDLPF